MKHHLWTLAKKHDILTRYNKEVKNHVHRMKKNSASDWQFLSEIGNEQIKAVETILQWTWF